jgi:EmrB/QacA subfamily drug resistance transporter
MRETLPSRSRWLALVVLCAGALMTILDATVVNVSLQSIQHDLGFSQSSLAWVVNAYLIAFGGLLLLAGRLGDLLGRKHIFVAGLAVFTSASVLCGLSTNRSMLVASRFVQGAGGALTMSVILGMIVTMFPDPREQARAIGVFSFIAAAGGALGLLLGGVLTEAISWHWAFFINVPIGAVALVLAVRLIEPEHGIGIGEGADTLGALLVTSSLMTGVYTIVGTTEHGWAATRTLIGGAVAVALLGAFVLRQATTANPLVPLRMFRSRIVAGANVTHGVMVAGMFGFFFLGSLYLQRVLGYQPIETGLAFLPITVAIAAFSLGITPALMNRFGPRGVLVPGLVLMAAGLAWFSRVPVDGHYALDVLPVTLLVGSGAGLALPSLMTLAMSAATPADSGLASGLITTFEQVGGAVGLSVLATFSASRTDHLLGDGDSAATALTSGYRFAFTIAAGLVLAAIGVALTALRPETDGAGDADDDFDTAELELEPA